MASNAIIAVGDSFEINDFCAKLAEKLQAKGYTATVNVVSGSNAVVTIEKDFSGFKKFIGLGLHVQANIVLTNKTLNINYTDADWLFKIIAYVVGAVISVACIGIALIITAVIGSIKQYNLPGEINTEATALAAEYK